MFIASPGVNSRLNRIDIYFSVSSTSQGPGFRRKQDYRQTVPILNRQKSLQDISLYPPPPPEKSVWEPVRRPPGKRFISPGPSPENVTTISPDGQHEKWDGTGSSGRRDKKCLLQTDAEKIAPLQDTVDVGEATDDEKT
ncbi:tail fiber assembly protein [Salmonella enterica]|uniref:tail fiber assembly protein n=1 Tax=Salmonella enterica TaxID=28901 RepID=UPI00159CC25D